MRSRTRISILLVLAICLVATTSAWGGALAPGLVRQLSGLNDSDEIRALVVLRDQVDVAALDRRLRRDKAGRHQRHGAVVAALQQAAARTQGDLLANLGTAKAGGGIRGFTPHWLINAVVVSGTVEAVRELAARDDVLRIEADLVPELIAPVASWRPPAKDSAGIGIAPGVVSIGARRVWDELGIDGSGALVGVIDSGVDVTHPAFGARWRGYFAPPAESWFDAAQIGHTSEPVDLNGHGTHVLGILTGVADGDTIGVAPGARWIATNGIQVPQSGLDNAIIASLEFMTDPDEDPDTTDDVPDVVQNSWGINEGFAGYVDCDSRWWDLIDNCEAAGVVLVWAAGNEGPGAGTMRSPADRASSPYNCFSVGSTRNLAPFEASYFSSRGPSGCGGSYAIKPEITAPGDTVYSADPGGGYLYRNGTSMAGPHVAGVVALMRQANPEVDVVTIKDILLTTALDLGDLGEDNIYGHGRVDAYAAVKAVTQGIGTVSGTVTAAGSGLPVAGALVRREGGENQVVTDAAGRFSLTMYAGPTTFTITAFGYFAGTLEVTIPDAGTANGDLSLVLRPTAEISGVVSGPDLAPVGEAVVVVQDTPVSAIADSAGFYRVALPIGLADPFVLRASAPGLGYDRQEVLLTGPLTLDFQLQELVLEDFESGGFTSLAWVTGGDLPWLVGGGEVQQGALSARSGNISNNQASVLSLDYYVAEASELSFWYKVSSEFGFDELTFLVDDGPVAAWSGEIDWSLYTAAIDRGHHTFTWRYAKDEAFSEGADTAWLDQIVLPRTGQEPFAGLAVDLPAVAVTLGLEAETTKVLTISNTGTADLNYFLTAVPIAKTDSPTAPLPPGNADSRRRLAKGAKDLEPPVRIRPQGTGGPDAFGYTWRDSDDPAGPLYAWFDITDVGTDAGAGDDLSLGPFDLGFPLTYYGEIWSAVRVSTNGFLSFNSTSAPYVNPTMPDPAVPNAVLAPFWDDLDASAGGQILTWSDPVGDRFIVQFKDVPRYASPATETFQVVLRSDGSIVYLYEDVSETGHCTVGLENAAGDDGLTLLYHDDSYLRAGLAIRFEPPGFLPWVDLSPLAGSVPPGDSSALNLRFESAGLAPGTHVATLNIASNDPVQPVMLVPLILTVDAASTIPERELPGTAQLYGAVPNPFNPRTEIHYALPRAGAVALNVYDLKGRLVHRLVDGVQPPGGRVAAWDGRDWRGRPVASGTYFARLVFGAIVQVKAMTLVR